MTTQELLLRRKEEDSLRRRRRTRYSVREDFSQVIRSWKKVWVIVDDPHHGLTFSQPSRRSTPGLSFLVESRPFGRPPVTADVVRHWIVDPTYDAPDNQEAVNFELRVTVNVHTKAHTEFEAHASEWKRDTAHLSDPSMIAEHHAYQNIIGMGEEAIPLILRDMEESPSLWFSALRSITGESPVRPEDRGDIDAMTAAWLDWGRRRRYI